MAMALFVAHFATLYCQSAGGNDSTAQQIASQGKATGIMVSKSVGDVSASYQAIADDLAGWAAWKLTIYGQQLATMAKMYGMGGMWIY